jgi:serine/threonine protein phosphatase PrpC
MPKSLKVSVGQFSDKGRKSSNQDFHGAFVPREPLLSMKGIAVALADGISSSDVSRIASESAIKSFLTDYYCTSEAWSVKTSAQRVIAAVNSWLYAQTRATADYDSEKGFVCTLTAMIVKSRLAYIFHVGDSRVYHLTGDGLEQLTEDHRVRISANQHYLGRALGVKAQIEIDHVLVPLEEGDTFLLATDGVYEHVRPRSVASAISTHASDLDEAARVIVREAYNNGSADNLTAQIVRVDGLPLGKAPELFEQATELPPPPLLEPRTIFEGYRIVREIHGSSRSHIYLAVDTDSGETVAIKTPSIDMRDDPAYLKRFMLEEWVARRINSPHVLKPCLHLRRRSHLYVAMEFIEGQTLTQWMVDNPKASLETVRSIIEQIAGGLTAFHHLEMLHQDIRPDNIMIDRTGTVKIIDFGSTRVAGVSETESMSGWEILGTEQYTAPEYFLGAGGSPRSDLFSLGVIAYQMLAGELPYGAAASRARTKSQQRKLRYRTALRDDREIPVWIDGALKKAVHPDPGKRYEALSEFTYDLRHPNAAYLAPQPLLERNPLLLWQGLSALMACVIAGLLLLLKLKS